MRVRRAIKRFVLGLLLLGVITVVAAVIFLHTDTGREVVRDRIQSSLAETFAGEVHVGKLEGSPFGTYVARDIVIDGPDGKPAIQIGKLSLELELSGLIDHEAVLNNVVVEDAVVHAKRMPDGSLSLAHLLRPTPPTAWNVVIRSLAIKRGSFDLEDQQPIHLTDIEVTGGLDYKADALHANATLSATWQERGVPLRAVLSLDNTLEGLTIPAVVASAGDVSVNAAGVRITKDGVTGTGMLRAPRAAVAKLTGVELPADVELAFVTRATSTAAQHVELTGTLGGDAVTASLDVWPKTKRISGSISAPDLQVATLTHGKIPARGGGSVELDLQLTDAVLPVGRFTLTAQGTYDNYPRTQVTVSGSSDGANLRGAIEATNPGLVASIAGEVAIAGKRITLTSATMTARSRDLGAASGRVVPIRGTITVALAAHGELRPTLDLAVAGTIDGKQLATRGDLAPLEIATLSIKVDGKHLPSKPTGRLELLARDLASPQLALRELTLRAANRPDGAIQATLRTFARTDPWLVEADALIRPGEPTTIDLQRHHVRAGAGTEWRGTGGKIVIASERIELRDLATASKDGALAIAGTYQRRTGDVTAKVDATTIALANLDPRYTGTLDANVDFSRRSGIVKATAELRAHDISVVVPRASATTLSVPPAKQPTTTPRSAQGTPVDGKSQIAAASGAQPAGTPPAKISSSTKTSATRDDIPSRSIAAHVGPTAGVPAGSASAGTAAERERRTPGFDATAKISIDGSRAVVDATLTSGITSAALAVELAGPSQITDPAAWRRLGRDAVKTATVRITKLDLETTMATLGVIGAYGGTIDGELRFAGTPTGALHLRGVMTPELRGLGAIDADLTLAAHGDDLVSTITARLDRIGAIEGTAEIQLPARLFDAGAWRALGRGAVKHVAIQARDLAIDPGRLEQFGVIATMRGRLSFDLDVIPTRAKLDVLAKGLRGALISDPIDAELHATIGTSVTDARVEVKLQNTSMFEGNFEIPLSFDQLLAAPSQLRGLPLSGAGRLHISASRLLGVFGRREITGGELDGSVLVAGTVGNPTAVASIVGTNIEVPPGPRGRPIKRIDRLAIDLVYEDNKASLIVDGTQPDGRLIVAANADLDALDKATMTITAKQFDLLPVLVFAPGPAGGAAGRLDADVKIRGLDFATMDITGTLALRNGRIPLAPNVGTLRRASIDLSIKNRIAQLTLDGRLGGGTVKATGSTSLDGGSGEIALTLRKVSPIGAVEPDIDADITIKLKRQAMTWIADIDVRNGKMVVPKTRQEPLAPAGAPPDMVFITGEKITRRPLDKAPPAQPTLIANIKIGPTRVESEEVRGVIRGSLQVTADAKAIGLLGSIEADRGDLDLFGRRYRVERAAVRFDGGIDPILDIQLVYDFPDVTTFTEVRGRLSKPRLVMTSNPGTYSQGQLLGFLLGGQPTGQPGDSRDRATSAGASFLANRIGGLVKGTLPIDLDVLRYESATATSSAAITVGTWLRHGLFLAYRQRLEARPDENTGEGEVEYWLGRRVVVEGVVGNRTNSVDLLWRKRY
jgi:hypothetical protein